MIPPAAIRREIACSYSAADRIVATDVTKQVTSSLIGNLQADIDLSEQEKERLEETLSNVDGPLNDEGEDENKKDPGGS